MFDQASERRSDYQRDFSLVRQYEAARAAMLAKVHESGIVRARLQRYLTVYHYTTGTALLPILEQGELWASSYVFLSSGREYTVGLDAIIKAVENSAQEIIIHYRMPLLAELQRQREAIYADLYGVNLSLSSDNLSEWRAYGADGRGYAIGLSLTSFVRTVQPQGWSYPVFYENSEHTVLAEMVVESCARWLNQPETRDDVAALPSEKLSHLIASLLTGFAPMMKEQGFREELEYRHVVNNFAGRLDVASGQDRNPPGPETLHFRQDAQLGLLVPYLRLRCYGAYGGVEGRMSRNLRKLPITNIIVGPRLPFEKVRFGLERVLRQNGYDDVVILPSTLRYLP